MGHERTVAEGTSNKVTYMVLCLPDIFRYLYPGEHFNQGIYLFNCSSLMLFDCFLSPETK